MKKSALIIGLGLSLFFFVSCNKKDTSTPVTTTPAVSDYFPMAVGDYWVYQQTQYDSSGNIIPQTWKNDSVVVKNDTVFNNKTYHILMDYNCLGMTTYSAEYYRDSSDCIVNEHGEVIFSIKTPGIIYTDILSSDTIAYVNYSYNGSSTNITVPAGTFTCVDFKGEVYRKVDNFNTAYLVHKYNYANIGTVKKMKLFVASLIRIDFDLLSYHIQ